MKKMLVASAIIATLALSFLAPKKFREPDAGINPPPVKLEIACILKAHQ